MTICRKSVLLSVLLVAACGTNSAIERSREYLEEGFLVQAFEVVDDARRDCLADGRKVDPELQRIHDELLQRVLVDAGRQAIYANEEERGLELLNKALALQPGDEVALALIDRAHRKQALRAVAKGQDLLAKAQLDSALVAFLEAQQCDPDCQPAMEGVEAVRDAARRLHGEAQQQFLEAYRKLRQVRFPEAEWHASASLSRDKARDDAADVQRRAQRELADEARVRAESSRKEKNYGAALMDYRVARQYWPDMPGIDDFIAQMETEVGVVAMTEKAQLAIKAGRLEEARGLLDDAFAKSTLEKGSIVELRFLVHRRAGEMAYEKARDLELQGLKQEALAAYEALVADWPDGLLDVQTRLGAIKADVEGAEREFAAGEAAEQANDPAAALQHYRTSKTYYEKYRDVAQRVERLAAKLATGQSGS